MSDIVCAEKWCFNYRQTQPIHSPNTRYWNTGWFEQKSPELINVAARISSSITYKHMYEVQILLCWYVVWAIEKSELDQVLSRKRPNSRWGSPFGVLFARRASLCSPLPTLPRAGSGVLASSPGDGCCFRFSIKINPWCLFVRIGTDQSNISHYKKPGGETGSYHSMSISKSRVWSPECSLLFGCSVFITSFLFGAVWLYP